MRGPSRVLLCCTGHSWPYRQHWTIVTNANPYAPPAAEVADQPQALMAPALWNPFAAGCWSLMFSPVFGALVQRQNWLALGETRRAQTSKQWAIGCLVVYTVIMVAGALFPESKALSGLSQSFGFVLTIAWYYGSGKAQQRYVTERFGKVYPRRGWGKPLLLGIAALTGMVVVLMLIGFLSVMIRG
jgi:hypothetical protein